MRHRVQGRKLGLPSDQRMALLRCQVRQLLARNFIITTETRAKEVRRIAERLITTAREDTIGNRRICERVLATETPERGIQRPEGFGALHPNRKAELTARLRRRKPTPTGQSTADYVNRLFNEIAPRFRTRAGGYTRIYKIGFRRGDAAPLVKLELSPE
ncbi:MAG: 50S ribosomal protein L17 [Armatimonadetes bacterium]|nr:50S ribosomal protein L17 [Armatimonadota bacterium]